MSILAPPRARTAKARLDRGSNGTIMTAEEFDAVEVVDPNFRYELVRGVVIVAPPPDSGERFLNDELGMLLRSYQRYHGSGRALDLTMPEHTVKTVGRRRPDRAIWAGLGRIVDEETEFPTIPVEFVGRRRRDQRRDYETKRDEYRAAGAKEYWIIDRFAKTMTVFRFAPEGTQERELGPNDVYETPLLPDFRLDMGALFDLLERQQLKGRKRGGTP